MPAKTSGSKLGGLLGRDFDNHKADETKTPKGGGDLPAGINEGVAQLVDIKKGVHEDGANKGKDYIYLAGIVVDCEPEFKRAIGGRTSKVIGLYPTADGKKSRADRVSEFLNELRLLGLDTSKLKAEDLDQAIEELVKQGPYFGFQTWKGQASKQYPNPRVNHKWLGEVKNYSPESGGNAVSDETTDQTDNSSEGAGDDLKALGSGADAGDNDCIDKLTELAIAAGYTEEQITNIDKWATLAEELATQGGESGDEGGETEPEAEPWKPAVGDVYTVKPKGARKAVEIEVMQVFKSTLKAKEVEGGKIHPSLTWSSNPDQIAGQNI